MQDIIPVTTTDVHVFISEKCDENLFLIDMINEENRMIEDEKKQINKTIKEAEDKVILTD
jgi:hypothetical protein